MTTRYVTLPEFDEYTSDEFGGTESGLRLGALKAAERAVDEYTQRVFTVAATPSARLYVPTGSDRLNIHDCTSVSAVTVSGAAISSTTYQLEPVAVSWAGLAQPYNCIRLLGLRWTVIIPGEATVSVTAAWGWTAVPDEVVEATKVLAKDIMQQRRVAGNMMAVGDFGGTVRMNTYVRRLLDPLRSVHAFGVA